jgi:Putative peptidoglycan binding domain
MFWRNSFELKIGAQIRRARFMVAGSLLIFACVAAANADQSSAADATAKKPATTTTKSSHPTGKSSHTTTKSSHPTATSSHKTSHKSTAKSSSSTHTTSSGKHSSKKKSAKSRGQQKIDSERAQAIQEALIREHYMSGEATGTWNQASEEAMRRYQADHGWQSKTVPDSRALIKLGLGPSKDHLLNPESAMTTVPDAPRTGPAPTSHSASPEAHTDSNPPLPADTRPAGTPDQDASRPQ